MDKEDIMQHLSDIHVYLMERYDIDDVPTEWLNAIEEAIAELE